MNHKNYILDKDHNLKEVDLAKWAEWFSNPKNKIVKQEYVNDYWISTAFLGLDHGFDNVHLWFETMVFKKRDNGKIDFSELDIDRYTTWDDAIKGHERMVKEWKNK